MADDRGDPHASTSQTTGTDATPFSETAVRELIRQEVASAVASALRDIPPTVGSPASGHDGATPSATYQVSLPTSLQTIPLFTTAATGSATLTVVPSTSTPTSTYPALSGWGALPSNPSMVKPKAHPFKVAGSIVPVPAKLVQRIQALEYVEMRELLPDNIALAERLATLPPGLAAPKPPGERDIGGDRALATWVSSFATYVAIVAQAHPERVADMLAYLRLVVREASKFGGNGWLTYDAVFRRNHEGPSEPWNTLDASLHQVYIANQQEKNHHPLQALPGGGPPGSRVCSCFSPPQNTAFHTGSLSQPTGRPPLSTKGKTALSALPPASHLPLLECRKLQVSWEMHICSCLCELLWPPPTVSVQRRRTCPSSPKTRPSPTNGTQTGLRKTKAPSGRAPEQETMAT